MEKLGTTPLTLEEANRLAFSKGFDAGNASCRAAGRTAWAPEDVAAASRAHHATLRTLGFGEFIPPDAKPETAPAS